MLIFKLVWDFLEQWLKFINMIHRDRKQITGMKKD